MLTRQGPARKGDQFPDMPGRITYGAMGSSLLKIVVKEVSCTGVIKGTGIRVVLDKRLRDPEKYPQDEDAKNEYAIVLRLKVQITKNGASKLENVPGWDKVDECGNYVRSDDTWINCDSENAEALMEIYAEAVAEHVSRRCLVNLTGTLASRDGHGINYDKVFEGIGGTISKIEDYILKKQETLLEKHMAHGEFGNIGKFIIDRY